MMRRSPIWLLVIALVTEAVPVRGQELTSHPPPDSAAVLTGAQAGSNASLRGAIWGSAAATFFLSPFVGGVGSVLLSRAYVPEVALPAAAEGTGAQEAAYQSAYVEAYRAAYQPRYRRAVTRSVLVTTILYFAGMFALAG